MANGAGFSSRREDWDLKAYVPAVLLGVLMSLLTCQAGFFDDDSVISLWNHERQSNGADIMSFCWSNLSGFARFQGRLPVVFSFGVLPILLKIQDNIVLYRLYFSAVYVISFVVARYSLGRILGGGRYANLVLLVFVACTQLQNYHDSYTSYFAYMPILMALVFLSFSTFQELLHEWINDARLRPSLLAKHLLLVAGAMLTWEVAIVTAVGTLFQALAAPISFQRRLKVIAIPLSWGAAFVIVNLMMKKASTNTGTLVNVASLSGIAHAYAVQLTATIPFFIGDGMFPAVWKNPHVSGVHAFIPALLFSIVTWMTMKEAPASTQESRPWRSGALCMAFSLIVVPPALTAVTSKYQRELQWGMGYLQTYVQVFGLAVAAALLIDAANRGGRSGKVLYWSCGLLLVSAFALNTTRNFEVITGRNSRWLCPRDLLEKTISQVPLDENVRGFRVDRGYLQRWETRYFSLRWTGRALPFNTKSSGGVTDWRGWVTVKYPDQLCAGEEGLAQAGRLVVDAEGVERGTVQNVICVQHAEMTSVEAEIQYEVLLPGGEAQLFSVTLRQIKADENGVRTLIEPRIIKTNSIRLVTHL